jgi:uncharacterized protein
MPQVRVTRLAAAAASLALIAFALPAVAAGPSFNCRNASTYVEIAICDSRELSRLDRVLNLEYQKAQNRLDAYDGQDLADAQEGWIADRDSCVSYRCVDRAYRIRIAQLRRIGR